VALPAPIKLYYAKIEYEFNSQGSHSKKLCIHKFKF
jgi:hypothetical protein